MRAAFWTSTAATWRLARFVVLALVAFVALRGTFGVLIATVVGVGVATLSLIDEVLARRDRITHRGRGLGC